MMSVSRIRIGSLSLAFLILLSPQISLAHPGNTAGDGCHYCRTNCDKWGEVWNERHCHNAKSITTTSKAIPKKTSIPKIDECSIDGLLKVYKDRRAKGELMGNLGSKQWWKKCPENVRKEVFKKIK
jgi:hypothetical protein